MSKSDDNTNELESYGVWVKNSTGNSDNTETPADPSDELNLDAGGLDLPDFDDSDFSDMFKEEPQNADSGAMDDFGSEDDTTLSTDELANITDGFEVEQVDAPGETDDLDLGDFDLPDSTESQAAETESEVEFEPETETETEVTEDDSSDISFDTEISDSDSEDLSFDFEDASTETESTDTEETAATDDSEEVEFGEDEEISLDDFMDGGFSDESVAAGNNGYEAGAEPAAAPSSSDTEELSLDDFMDGDSFDSAPEAAKEAEQIEDEAPLDMDISFDDSADSIETEDNVSLDISSDDDDQFEDTDTEEVETEEVSLDDFGSSFTAEETSTPSSSGSDENISTEDVDLSDFGIDADAEETPIVQDVEEAKNKEKVVDYDLSVGDENTASAPVVNEIKSDTTEETVTEAAEPVEETPAPAANTTTVDNSLLQQIVSELSSLKDEMNKLKTNLQEIKSQENTVSPAATVAAGVAGLAAGAAVAAAATTEADEIPEAKDEGGFFSGDDEDETIALSFDELDNIMNTAEFGDTVEADNSEASEEETPAETEVSEEPAVTEETEEPVIEETSVEIEEPASDELNIEETETVAIEEEAVDTDDTVIDESIISSEVEAEDDIVEDSVESEIENAISDETDTSLDDINFDENQSENFDFSDEKLEEPKIDEFIPDGNDELYENEELPDEISIPKGDDLLVESTSSDFMDSVKETTEEDSSPEFIADDTAEEDTLDLPTELPDDIGDTTDSVEEPVIEETVTAEPEIEIGEDLTSELQTEEAPSFEDETVIEENLADEPIQDEIVEEEPFVEEEVAVEETVEEEAASEETIESDFTDDDIPTVDKVLGDDTITEETEVSETEVEEPSVEETVIDEPVVEETEVNEDPASAASFAEVDNLDNTLSESNLAYLDKTESNGLSDSIANADLKQDIKSVLLYMDQLLENLPEEKIVEFAKSDEFVTYKKLFNELGLS